MLTYKYIQEESRKAAKKAKAENRRPAHIREFNPQDPGAFCKEIPFLGDYVPEGWEAAEGIEDIFVDSSGFGAENEPALSLAQFGRRLDAFRKSGDPYGFGISEAGQFQVYVRVYRPDRRDPTNTGLLSEAELRLSHISKPYSLVK